MACNTPAGVPSINCCESVYGPPEFRYLQYVHPFNGWVADWMPNVDFCTRYRKVTFHRNHGGFSITIVKRKNKGTALDVSNPWFVAFAPEWLEDESNVTVSGPSGLWGKEEWDDRGGGNPNGVEVRILEQSLTATQYQETWQAVYSGNPTGYMSVLLEEPYTLDQWRSEFYSLIQSYGENDLPNWEGGVQSYSAFKVAYLNSALTPNISNEFTYLLSDQRGSQFCSNRTLTSSSRYRHWSERRFLNGQLGTVSPCVTIGQVRYYGPYCVTTQQATGIPECEIVSGASGAVTGFTRPPWKILKNKEGWNPPTSVARPWLIQDFTRPGIDCSQWLNTCQKRSEPAPNPLPATFADYPVIDFLDKPESAQALTMGTTRMFEHTLTGLSAPPCTSCSPYDDNPAP